MRLDTRRLRHAMNVKRVDVEMSWKQLAAELGTSVSTLDRMRDGYVPKVDIVLAALTWLGRTDVAEWIDSSSERASNEEDEHEDVATRESGLPPA
jgi:transcriptional regulator with XRE-family HTH domain